jgi:L-rhamnose mutarotase
MQSVGQLYRVKPGMAEEYARRHAETPEALNALLRDAGIHRFAIYMSGESVFAHFEVDDYAAMVARYNRDPVALAWEKEMEGLIEYPDLDPDTGWPSPLRLVWEL